MQKLYKVYPTGGFHQTLENFWKYHFYTTGRFYDYAGREKIFQNAEVLMLGNPMNINSGKYISNRYVGKIKNMGMYYTKYLPKTDEMTFQQGEVLIGEPLSDEEITRLKAVVLNQCHWQEQTTNWSSGVENVYIEVFFPNSFDENIALRQKFLYELPFDFDDDGKIIQRKPEEKIFPLTENIVYNREKHCFEKDGELIFFSPYNKENKQKFIETLIDASPKKVRKEELFEILWFQWIDANKKLLELKRSIIQYEFVKYLWLSRDFVETNILCMFKNQGYSINEYTKKHTKILKNFGGVNENFYKNKKTPLGSFLVTT